MCAANGREGVDMAEKVRPDLILMDLDMPVMNGWDATKKLKGSSSTNGIPVIALTAHFSALDRDDEYEAGAEAFVTKPIDFDVLFKKIDEFLR